MESVHSAEELLSLVDRLRLLCRAVSRLGILARGWGFQSPEAVPHHHSAMMSTLTVPSWWED